MAVFWRGGAEIAVEVMIEQADYLLRHYAEHGLAHHTCHDCTRAKDLTDVLLQPFAARRTRSMWRFSVAEQNLKSKSAKSAT